MSIWDKLKGELIDIVEWLDTSQDTLVYRFERLNNEIKYNAKLVVREGQQAVFVNEGQIADVFGPGTHTLETRNLPILATLQGWKYGFESPFKAEVYFVSTRRFTDLKWGTMNPIMLRDEEFGPVRVRAYGTYVMQAKDPAALIREIVGTDGHFTIDEITEQLRNMIVSRFGDLVGERKIPVLDLAANYDELGTFLSDRLQAEFMVYGLELMKLLVENISVPPEVEEALDKRSSMGIIGDLSKYTQFQAAEALRDAAQNEGGGAGAGIGGGMGMGMGFAMGNQMAGAMNPQHAQQTQQGQPAGTGPAPASQMPPPLPATVQYHVAVDGRQTGPFPIEDVVRRIVAGEIGRDTLVWKPGMAQWAPAAQAGDLQGAFQQVPPPLS